MATARRTNDTREVIESLAEQVRKIEGARPMLAASTISSGSAVLDRALPTGGFYRGGLVEWLAGRAGGGAALLAGIAAAQAARAGGALVVIDRPRRFYPPAALRWGIELDRLIVVRPVSEEDHVWAVDQALRCAGVAAVWGTAGAADEHTYRRWQLAAEQSGVLGLLLRPHTARQEPSWADWRLLVEPLAPNTWPTAKGGLSIKREPATRTSPTDRSWGGDRQRRLRVEVLRCRGGSAGRSVELEIPAILGDPSSLAPAGTHDETRSVHLAAQLASAKTGRRLRGA